MAGLEVTENYIERVEDPACYEDHSGNLADIVSLGYEKDNVHRHGCEIDNKTDLKEQITHQVSSFGSLMSGTCSGPRIVFRWRRS